MRGQDVVDGTGQAATAPAAGPSLRSSLPRTVLSLGVVVAVVVIAITHRSILNAGSESLASADLEWLVLAGGAALALLLVGSVTQLGSMPIRLPFGRVLAVQAAANFMNHLVPAGAGGIGINIRFLRRHGLDRAAAASATGLNAAAGAMAHTLMMLAAIAISPSLADQVGPSAEQWYRVAAHAAGVLAWIGVVLGALLLVAGTVLAVRRRLRERVFARCSAVGTRLWRELRRLGAVLRNPWRAAALWIGSLTTPMLHVLVVFAVARSLNAGLGFGTVVVVYLVVSTASALIPSPGGLGALDVALVAGLVAVGTAATAALAIVLGYRLITVWLPFVPGALVLTVLLRRRII